MTAMPLKLESAIAPDKRRGRRLQLALMRGVQSIVGNRTFRAALFECAVELPAVNGVTKEVGACTSNESLKLTTVEMLEPFPAPADVSALDSPSISYVSRKPKKTGPEEDMAVPPASEREGYSSAKQAEATPEAPGSLGLADTASLESSNATTAALSQITSSPSSTNGSANPQKAERTSSKVSLSAADAFGGYPSPSARGTPARAQTPTRLGSTMDAKGERPSTASRPVTPGFLDPPWARKEIPFQSWSRPGTPSTVCDEAELATAPKGKFVDGQYIQMRPTSSSMRLPPINSASPSSRNLW